MNILIIATFAGLSGFVGYEAHKRGRNLLALFAVFWLGYNVRSLMALL